MSTAVAGRPSVWIGCVSCLNEGRLVGRWVDAEEACEVAVDDLHDGQVGEGCGEIARTCPARSGSSVPVPLSHGVSCSPRWVRLSGWRCVLGLTPVAM